MVTEASTRFISWAGLALYICSLACVTRKGWMGGWGGSAWVLFTVEELLASGLGVYVRFSINHRTLAHGHIHRLFVVFVRSPLIKHTMDDTAMESSVGLEVKDGGNKALTGATHV